MTAYNAKRVSGVLPLPAFVLHPFTAVVIAIVHVYLSYGHLSKLFGGDLQWTHIWKGFGALAGAYIFAALASHGVVRRATLEEGQPPLPTSQFRV